MPQISEQQKRTHMTSEAIGLFIAAPLLFWVSTKQKKGSPEQIALISIALGTAAIDAYLLEKYRKMK